MSVDTSLAAAFVRARHYTKGPRSKGSIDLLVIHATAGREVKGGARGVARWFADPNTRRASAHYTVDDKEIIQSVKESDIAWGAAHANHQGIHVEHVGLANQSAAQWQDVYSSAELRLSIALAADICKRNNIPPVWLMPRDLLAGKRGVTSHVNIDLAWPSTGHTDPGPGFPALWYCREVSQELHPLPVPIERPALWRDPATGAVYQPVHLAPVQWAELTSKGWVTINATLPPRTVRS